MTKPEMVDHPEHYNGHPSGVECIDIVEHMGFNLGNAMKYIWRADLKGASAQDLEKAAWYLEREIALRKKDQPKASPKLTWQECWCHDCHLAADLLPETVILCPDCGNNSCARSLWHGHRCEHEPVTQAEIEASGRS